MNKPFSFSLEAEQIALLNQLREQGINVSKLAQRALKEYFAKVDIKTLGIQQREQPQAE